MNEGTNCIVHDLYSSCLIKATQQPILLENVPVLQKLDPFSQVLKKPSEVTIKIQYLP